VTSLTVGDHPVVQVDHRLIEALHDREHELVQAEKSALVGSWDWAIAANTVSWSPELYRIFGVTTTETEPTYAGLLERFHPDDRLLVESQLVRAAQTLVPFSLRHRIVRPDGEVRHVETVGEVVGVAGVAVKIHSTVLDRTADVLVMQGIQDVSNAFELVRLTADAVHEAADLDGALQCVLDHVCRIHGWSGGRAWRVDTEDPNHLVSTELAMGAPAQPVSAPSLLASQALERHQLQARRPGSVGGMGVAGDAATSPVGLAVPIVVADEVQYVLEFEGDQHVVEDHVVIATIQSMCSIVAQRIDYRSTARLLEEAHSHDPLTGLMTRGLFGEQARRALTRVTGTRRPLATFSIDLDNFRHVNEYHGHDGGDEVLVRVAERLRTSLRQRDNLARGAIAITRVGGDEFLLLCETAGDEAAAVAIQLASGQVVLTARIGIAMSSPDSDPQQLILDAEAAQRHAKELGGAGYQFFNAEHRERTASTSALVEALHRAVRDHEFRLMYQPKIALATNRIVGVEALLRWDHPESGLIMPDDFISTAEVSGVIVPIGAWVLKEACQQAAVWHHAYPKSRLQLAVNVSARQFRSGLAHTIREAVEEAGITPNTLRVEMTETTIMDDIDSTVGVLDELKSLGFTVSVDDFGTGYSSLEYLHRMPIDEVKIDRSFVAGLGTDSVNTAIVASVISLAHAMNLEVVAEGVEAFEQLERLRSLGCDFAQGYFIAPPMLPDAIDDYLAADSAGQEMQLVDPTGGIVRLSVTETVLVVDDTADLRMLAMMSLTAVGFAVEEAGNGASALALARRVVPQCVLLDMSMPDMSGIEVCKALRDDPITAECTIVMLTSQANPADKAEAFLAGADDYIVKPFAPRDLVARVRTAVRRRHSRIGVVDQVDRALVEMLQKVREQNLSDEALADTEQFSSRQIEVLRRLLNGERVPAIARALFLSQSTVRNHLSAIYQRVGVHSQEELLSLFRARVASSSNPTRGSIKGPTSAPPSVDVDDHVSGAR
jgi:diguanylate cyclase (GGDEF)-like protein